MKDLFTIGEVSRLFNTNIRTLRYYDSIGLLKPTRVDERTGYRYYSTKDFERLNTIKYLRTLDMPLENIAQFFDNKEISVMEELLTNQKEQIQGRIEELCRIRTKIDNRLELIAEAKNSDLDKITLREIGRRRAAFLRKNIAVTDDLELPIRELERMHDLEPIIFLGKVGVSIDKEKIKKREFTSFSSIFVLVERSDEYSFDRKSVNNSQKSYIEKGLYLCIRFHGTHIKASEYYEKLLAYAEANQYDICGDSIEITLIDAGLTNELSSYVTEIQLPVVRII